LFLSKLELNLRCPRVREELSDVYEMHRTIMRAFPDGIEGPGRTLFRIERKESLVTVIVQSKKQPDWKKLNTPNDYFIRPPQSKTFDPTFYEGQQLIFRLMANPTVKRDGKRWGLVREEEQRQWIERKASQGGFSIMSLRVVQQNVVEGEKKADKRGLTFTSITYEGTLSIVDPEKFRDTLENGVGSGKGFGFGLLSVAPLH